MKRRDITTIITTVVVATIGQYTISMVNLAINDYFENQAVRTFRTRRREFDLTFIH